MLRCPDPLIRCLKYRRANERSAFGGPLADKQFVQESIAASRMEIDQARLLTLYAAWKMDTEGKRAARQAISAVLRCRGGS